MTPPTYIEVAKELGGRMRYLILIFLLSGCGWFDKREANDQEEATPNAVEIYDEARTRLFLGFVVNGFVVSRWVEDGKPVGTEHEGEAILFNGIAMASLPCADGVLFEDRVIRMLDEHSGALVRYEPLGEYAGGREITLDGAIGLYHGVAYRLANCPESIAQWTPAWERHLDYLDDNGGKLHANAKDHAVLPAEFTVLRDAISHKLGLRGKPHADRIKILEAQATAWAAAVVNQKQPAYRINLAFLTLQGIEYLGHKIHGGAFCAAAKGARLADLEHWCGRSGLMEWIADFQYNRYEYAFQRGAWETPDGKPTLRTPGVDLLRAINMAYKL